MLTFLVEVVTHEAIENENDVISLGEEPVLVDDAGLVLEEGENR